MNGSIALARADDGTLSGEIAIGPARWTITAWRSGGDKLHILFDAQPVADDWVDRFARGETP